MVTWLKFEKSTDYCDPATRGYYHPHLVEDLGAIFSSPGQKYLVAVKNIDEHVMKFVEVRTD